MDAIEFQNFSCYYKLKRDYVTALKDVTFSVEAGAFVVLVGASGGGKTTLLRACLGFADYFEGALLLNGVPIEEGKVKQNNCAYVSQELALYPHLNVYENIAFPLRQMRTPHEELDRRVREMAACVGLELFLTRKPKQLSVGQQQRVVLARAMIKNPSFLFLDEPFSNIDPALRSELRRLVKDMHRQFGPTVLFVTHDLNEAFTLAERIIVLEEGRVVADGTPEQLMQARGVLDAYLDKQEGQL